MITVSRCIQLGIAALFLSCGAQAELIISEYLEGKSRDKALEIYNTGAEAIDLTAYVLRRCTDGNCRPSGNFDWDSIDENLRTLGAHSSLVFVNKRASRAVKEAVENKPSVIESSLTNFNGNDPIQILKDGVVIDTIGFMDGHYFAKDRLLRRRQPQPSATYDPTEWESIEIAHSPPANDLIQTLGSFSPIAPVPGVNCESSTLTAIGSIQGRGSQSPQAGNIVTVEGLVTLIVPDGFFVQTPASREGRDETTSEGLFVSGTIADMAVQDLVRIRGTVKEAHNETRIQDFESGKVCQAAGEHHLHIRERTLPEDIILQKWQPGPGSMEPYEGMVVKFSGHITKTYGYNDDSRQNDTGLASRMQYKPTQLFRPGEEAEALDRWNKENRIVVKSTGSQVNGDIEYYPQFEPNKHPLRVGTKVVDIPVVVGYGYGNYFFYPAEPWKDSQLIPSPDEHFQRHDAPAAKDPGHVRIASVNLLNFFTNDVVENAPPLPEGVASQGASSADAFSLQRQKLVTAILRMDADIVGLLEVGNNGKDVRSALGNLVASLNFQESNASKHYAYVYPQEGDHIGSDAMSVGLIFRPQVFTPSGSLAVLDMPKEVVSWGTIGQRNSLVQTFCKTEDRNTCITTAVNHFKSKYCSGCADDQSDDDVGLQGCCTRLRVSAAVRLGEYMKANHANDDVILLGGFNAYGREDPMFVLEADNIPERDNIRTSSAADFPPECTTCPTKGSLVTSGYSYVSLSGLFHGPEAFSYTSDGELGSPDHVLGNASLAEKAQQVINWHINSLENPLFEYDSRYTGDLPKSPGPFSSSDHDPVLVDLAL